MARLLPGVRVLSRCFSSEAAWKLGKLNHVAVAVPDLEKASSLYRDVLGADVSQSVVRTLLYMYTCDRLHEDEGLACECVVAFNRRVTVHV